MAEEPLVNAGSLVSHQNTLPSQKMSMEDSMHSIHLAEEIGNDENHDHISNDDLPERIRRKFSQLQKGNGDRELVSSQVIVRTGNFIADKMILGDRKVLDTEQTARSGKGARHVHNGLLSTSGNIPDGALNNLDSELEPSSRVPSLDQV